MNNVWNCCFTSSVLLCFVIITVSCQTFEERLELNRQRIRRRSAETLRQEAERARTQPRRTRGSFLAVQRFMGGNTDTRFLSLSAMEQLEALREVRSEMQLSRTEMREEMANMRTPFLQPSGRRVVPDDPRAIDTSLPNPGQVCPFRTNGPDNGCDPNAPFRTLDGTCNNLRRPLWGGSNRALGRFVEPDYADGIGDIREAEFGGPLPNVRDVSLGNFLEGDNPSPVHTLMLMIFGQFTDHELTRTAMTQLSESESGTGRVTPVECGRTGCATEGAENRACFPIPVRRNDPDFGGYRDCLMFVRTGEVTRDDCPVGPREQLNQLTSWIDASNVYGSTLELSLGLRDLSDPARGRLLTTRHPFNSTLRPLPPYRDNPDCRDVDSTIQCFLAGDGRINEQAGLTTVHIIFIRTHNLFEERLHQLNPQWDGERLYQETRKIIGAILQRITFAEYLPVVLGPLGVRQNGLRLQNTGYFDGYDRNVNPDVSNAFATAAFRFAHSQIGDFLRFINKFYTESEDRELSTLFRRPFQIYNTDQPGGSFSGVDALLLGSLQRRAELVDRFFSKEVTAHLFAENPPLGPGEDLVSINIMRGRDHGIPAYNKWREWCRLKQATSFDDLVDMDPEVREGLSRVYDDVRDMDLYPAVLERTMPGATVGPTFACIIGRQFSNARAGDRFWFERDDPVVGFTPGQLSEIRKATLARIICLGLDDVGDIQPLTMLQPISEAFRRLGANNFQDAYAMASLYAGEDNERRPCSEIPDIDLTPWQEDSQRARPAPRPVPRPAPRPAPQPGRGANTASPRRNNRQSAATTRSSSAPLPRRNVRSRLRG